MPRYPILYELVSYSKSTERRPNTDEAWTSKLITLKAGLNKKYGALSVLNQIIPSLVSQLAAMFSGACFATTGRDTAAFRAANGIAKDHQLDACCIACSTLDTTAVCLPTETFVLHRFRRHDRAAISRQEERKYYLDGQLVARNRHKRMEQKTPSLEEFRLAHPAEVGMLAVAKGAAKYKDLHRILPGAIYVVDGHRMVLQGRHGKAKNGQSNYLEFFGHGNFTPKHCKFISRGQGWQFV